MIKRFNCKIMVVLSVLSVCLILGINIVYVENQEKKATEIIATNDITKLKQYDMKRAKEKYENVVVITGVLAKMSLEDLKKSSALIVYGTVKDKSDAFLIESVNGTESIFTDYYFEPSYILRGEDKNNTITIRIEGGAVEDMCVIDEKGPVLIKDNSYLLFLKKPIMGGYTTRGDYYYINGATQGVYMFANNRSNMDFNSIDKVTSQTKSICMMNETGLSDASLDLVSLVKGMEKYNKDNILDEDYLEEEYLKALNHNLSNNLITKEDYDASIAQMNQYANIK